MLHDRLVPLLAAGALALTACGGGDDNTVTQAEWVTAVCAASNSQDDTMDSKEDAFEASMRGDGSPEEKRDAIVLYLGDAATAMGEIADEFGAAGVPDVDNGDEAAEAVVSKAEAAEKAIEAAKDDAEDLPTADEEEFETAAQELLQGLSGTLDDVKTPLAGVDAPELAAALGDADCGFSGEPSAATFVETAEEQIVEAMGDGAEVECEEPADTEVDTTFDCATTVAGNTTTLTVTITGEDTILIGPAG